MKKYLEPAFLIFISLVAEGIAFYTIVMTEHNPLMLMLFLLLHMLYAYLMAAAQIRFLPKLYQTQKERVTLFILFFNFLVPVLGALFGWILLLWGFKKSQHIEIETEIEEVDMEDLSEGFPVIERIFGEGSLQALISSHNAPAQRKIKALSLLTQMKTKASLSLIKQTLHDPNDEVRLVGFSMIDNMEKKINEKIHHLKIMIRTQRDPLQKALHHRELAFTYWELLYQGLFDENLRPFLIENTLHEIEEAKKVIQDDVKLYKLEGRIHLQEGRYAEAKKAFVQALDLGIPQIEVASFMAEISFREKNHSRIAYWMEKTPCRSINYQLHTLRAVWVREAK